jgi:O-antigen ligase
MTFSKFSLAQLIACSGLLMLVCFSSPGRFGPTSVASLDVIAALKLAARCAAFVLLIGLLLRRWRLPQRHAVLACLGPLGLFVGWAVLSVLWSPLKAVSFGQAGGLVVLWLLAANVGLTCRQPPQVSTLLCGLSCSLLGFSTVVLVTNLLWPESGSLSRDHPGIVHPTIAGSAASLGLVLLVAARLLWGWTWSRWLLPAGLVVYSAVLVAAANRTALGLAVLLVSAMFLLFANRPRVLAATLAVCSAVTSYLVLDPGWQWAEAWQGTTTEYVHRGRREDLRDFSGRREMWSAMWASYQQSPWVGHGYFVSSARGELHVWGNWANWTAHNVVLQTLVSTGVVGAVLLAWAVGTPLVRMLRSPRVTRHHQKIAWLLGLIAVWYVIWGLFNESIVGPMTPESVLFFALLGLAAGHAAPALHYSIPPSLHCSITPSLHRSPAR